MKWNSSVILFLSVLSLPFCAYADTVSKMTTTVTKSTTTVTVSDTDAKIIAAIYTKYAKDAALIGTKLTVDSVNGNVAITGSVTMQSQEDAAVSTAKSVEGVKTVVPNIIVSTHPETIQPAVTKKY